MPETKDTTQKTVAKKRKAAPKKTSVIKKSVRSVSVSGKVPLKRSAPRRKTISVATDATRPAVTSTGLYPSTHYTRWTLVAVGEFYLMTILGALVMLGILYWATVMTSVWQTVDTFIR